MPLTAKTSNLSPLCAYLQLFEKNIYNHINTYVYNETLQEDIDSYSLTQTPRSNSFFYFQGERSRTPPPPAYATITPPPSYKEATNEAKKTYLIKNFETKNPYSKFNIFKIVKRKKYDKQLKDISEDINKFINSNEQSLLQVITSADSKGIQNFAKTQNPYGGVIIENNNTMSGLELSSSTVDNSNKSRQDIQIEINTNNLSRTNIDIDNNLKILSELYTQIYILKNRSVKKSILTNKASLLE